MFAQSMPVGEGLAPPATVGEFAVPYKASDTEAARQCCELLHLTVRSDLVGLTKKVYT